MKRKQLHNLILLVFFAALFTELWMSKLISDSRLKRLSEDTVQTQEYRAQEISEELLLSIREEKNPSMEAGLYLLESKFGYQTFPHPFSKKTFANLKDRWKNQKGWETYQTYTKAIWDDLMYFPIPESTTDKKMTVTFTDSWMSERTYGGKRGHEGTDIMATCNVTGIYPIVSMTDGIVRSKGWLEKGGYRIGIEAPLGAYFYYAHLDSYANIEIGDKIRAGELLGFMGNTGYGEEGTAGKFPVHLHVGVYIYPKEQETSVNPYWLLRYLENRKVKCAYSYGDIK